MNTSSILWPNMFDVSRNKVSVAEDRTSIVNRVKLLILTDPTELYMNPEYGVGLKKYMFQYNNDNVIARIRENIVAQLRLWEPCVDAEKTVVERGLTYTDPDADDTIEGNHLKLTVTLTSIYGDTYSIDINDSSISG